ncbi:MAG: hypothetical protein Q7S16_01235 [bacterium]|nr:hypothetical protein [bacterium]
MKGKLIVLYGINNLGKTTQAKMLTDRLRREKKDVVYIKYPIYTLAPSGPIVSAYLREGNPYALTPREFQTITALNRTQYESTLQAILERGTIVVAEDYLGTGIAWGEGAGVDPKFLRDINSALYKEDIAILLHGRRFTFSIEKNHTHEEDSTLMERVRVAHEQCADERGWIRVAVDGTKEYVHEKIWEIIKKLL